MRDREHHTAQRVPLGHCWVEGDNARRSTSDSNKLGPIPLALVTGRVTRIVWPPARFGRMQPTFPDPDRYVRKATKNKDAQ